MKEINTNENNYVKKISYNSKSPLDNMRTFAIKNNIPIIGDEALRFLELILCIKKPKKILEVGTAIAYSTSAMLLNTDAHIVTIEKSEKMYHIAQKNLKELNLLNRVKSILGDAGYVLMEMSNEIKNEFDFVFIDASKSHYLEHFKLIEPMLKEGATIIFDNVLYLGLIAGRRTINRNKTIRQRMQALIDYVINKQIYKFSLLQSEDGLLVLYKEKGVSK